MVAMLVCLLCLAGSLLSGVSTRVHSDARAEWLERLSGTAYIGAFLVALYLLYGAVAPHL